MSATSLLQETVIPLTRVPAHGRPGRFLNISTPFRWATKGLKGPDGQLVHLEVIRHGGKLLTSLEALARFAERLTPDYAADATPAPPTAGQLSRAAVAAGEKLELLGI
jgi:hypothetical protein